MALATVLTIAWIAKALLIASMSGFNYLAWLAEPFLVAALIRMVICGRDARALSLIILACMCVYHFVVGPNVDCRCMGAMSISPTGISSIILVLSIVNFPLHPARATWTLPDCKAVLVSLALALFLVGLASAVEGLSSTNEPEHCDEKRQWVTRQAKRYFRFSHVNHVSGNFACHICRMKLARSSLAAEFRREDILAYISTPSLLANHPQQENVRFVNYNPLAQSRFDICNERYAIQYVNGVVFSQEL